MDADRDWEPFRITLMHFASLHGRKISEPTIRQWWEALVDLSWRQVHRGFQLLEQHGEGWPKPLDLRRLVVTGRQETDAEVRAREQRDRDDAEAREFKADPEKVAAAKARLQLLAAHGAGDHRGRFLDACGACHLDQAHPAQHLHLRPPWYASDIDWENAPKVEGCCA